MSYNRLSLPIYPYCLHERHWRQWVVLRHNLWMSVGQVRLPCDSQDTGEHRSLRQGNLADVASSMRIVIFSKIACIQLPVAWDQER